MRMIVTKRGQSFQQLYMTSLQMELIGYTEIKAQYLMHKEVQSWIIVTLANLALPIGRPEDETGTDTILESATWDEYKIPEATHPTFKTCNIRRFYDFEVRVGFRYGAPNSLSVRRPPNQPCPLFIATYVLIPFAAARNRHPPPQAPRRSLLRRPTPSCPPRSRPHGPAPHRTSHPPPLLLHEH